MATSALQCKEYSIDTFLGIEPAFLDRDLFLDAHFANTEDGDELELEAEVEWALTRRIGMVFELPYAVINPDTGKNLNGIGDSAIASRFLLGDTERLMLSANMEVTFPSGDENRNLGTGEFGLAPSISGWMDLRNWFSAGIQLGTEHGLKSDDKELFYGLALGYTFLTIPTKQNEIDHFPPGMANLIVEWTGRTGLDGDDPHSSKCCLGQVTM